MTIERLGPVNPISRYNKMSKTSKSADVRPKDSVNVSEEARMQAEILKVTEELKQTDDVRLDRIEAVKKKLEDPNYIDNAVVDTVADRLMDVFGL